MSKNSNQYFGCKSECFLFAHKVSPKKKICVTYINRQENMYREKSLWSTEICLSIHMTKKNSHGTLYANIESLDVHPRKSIFFNILKYSVLVVGEFPRALHTRSKSC